MKKNINRPNEVQLTKQVLNTQLKLLKGLEEITKNQPNISIEAFRKTFCWASELPRDLTKIKNVAELRKVIQATKVSSEELPSCVLIKERLKRDLRKSDPLNTYFFDVIYKETRKAILAIKEQIKAIK